MASASEYSQDNTIMTREEVDVYRQAFEWRIEQIKTNLGGIESSLDSNNLQHKRQQLAEILQRLNVLMCKFEELEQLCHETL